MPKTSVTFYIILGNLNFGPQSGYDIKKGIEDSTGEFWKVNYGQIYPMLKSMVEEGYAVLLSDQEEGKRERKVYQITQKGTEEFYEWLAQPINFNNPQGNELLVKLFFGKNAPVRDSIRRLKEYRRTCVDYLERMEKIQAEVQIQLAGNVQLDYSIITVRFGLMTMKARIEWCDECIERLSKALDRDQ